QQRCCDRKTGRKKDRLHGKSSRLFLHPAAWSTEQKESRRPFALDGPDPTRVHRTAPISGMTRFPRRTVGRNKRSALRRAVLPSAPATDYRADVPNYRRAFVPGGCWFFTVNLTDEAEGDAASCVASRRNSAIDVPSGLLPD